MVVNYISVLTQTYLTMETVLGNLPKRKVNKFFHPESHELILSLAAAGVAFTFWNSINIRPSLLTDPAYQDQKTGLERNMNLSMLAISLMAAGISLVYGREGYIPSIIMFATGAGMYAWTAAELNRTGDASSYNTPTALSDSVHPKSMSILYHPAGSIYQPRALPPKTKREHALA